MDFCFQQGKGQPDFPEGMLNHRGDLQPIHTASEFELKPGQYRRSPENSAQSELYQSQIVPVLSLCCQMQFWLCDCCYNSGILYKSFNFVHNQCFYLFSLFSVNETQKVFCFLLLVCIAFPDKCPLSLQSIRVQCTGIQTKHFLSFVWAFFFFF